MHNVYPINEYGPVMPGLVMGAVREGSRKPFSIRHVLYSKSIRPDEVARLREVGARKQSTQPLVLF